MKSMIKKTLALVAAVCGGWAFGATPLAVWDGSSSDLGSFTLTTDNGNTIGEDKTITISDSATGGVVYAGEDSSLNNCTFIIHGSGLDLENSSAQYLVALHQNILGGGNGDASYNKVGASLGANNATVQGVWGNALYTTAGTVGQALTTGNDIAINIQTSGGVFVYEILTDATTGARSIVQRYANTGLKASNTNYKGFSIGGKYEKDCTSLVNATGWTISKMAVFGSTLSTDEMLSYLFPSEIVEVPEDTTVSAINTANAGLTRVGLSVANGKKITLDAAFTASSVTISSTGNVTLEAETVPSAAELAKLDVSGVAGYVARTWLTPGIVGMNFNANGGRNAKPSTVNAADVSGALASGGTWYSDPYNTSGTQAISADGLTKLTWSCNNVYTTAASLSNGTFMQGYLDDGGNQAQISITGIPYETYDIIIYCATDDSSKKFKTKLVNGQCYTYGDDGSVVVTNDSTAAWGSANVAVGAAVYGSNTMRINGLTGTLTIKGGASENSARGCIAAVQIMPTGEGKSYALSLAADASATWSTAGWTGGDGYPTTDAASITLAGSATLTIDQTIKPAALTVIGESSSVLTLADADNMMTISGNITSTGPVLKKSKFVIEDATIAAGVNTAEATEFFVGAEKTGTVTGAISGSGKVTKTGAGTLLATGRGTYAGGVDVTAGTFKLGGSGNFSFWNGTAIGVSVADGATLDINGASGFKADLTLAAGATYANSGSEVGTGAAQAHGIILNGDATVTTDTQFGLLANSYTATTLTLNDHTLTKTGTGDFILCNTTVSGAGTIDVQAGSVTVHNGAVTASSATINLAAGTELRVNVGIETTVSGSGTIVYGAMTPNKTITLADGNSVAVKVQLPNWSTTSATIPLSGTPTSITVVDPDGNTSQATYTRAENGTITVTVPVAPESIARANPVTGDEQAFTWAFRGTTDSAWATAGNWYQLANRRWIANTATKAPGVTGTDANPQWDAMLIDGNLLTEKSITATGLEGWRPKFGLFNGVTVTVNDIAKIQDYNGNNTWFMIDATSKLIIKSIGSGNSDGTIPLYVAAPDGLEFESAYGKSDTTFAYFLKGQGSVKFDAAITAGTHTITNATIEIGENTNPKAVLSKTLVSFASSTVTFTTADAVVTTTTEGVTPTLLADGDLNPTMEVGTYKFVQTDTALKIQYIGYNGSVVAKRTVDDVTLGYWSLGEAVNAAVAGETITVLKAASGTVSVEKNLTIVEGSEYLADVQFTVADGKTLTVTFDKSGEVNKTFKVAGAEGATSATLVLNPTAAVGLTDSSSFSNIKLSVNSANGSAMYITGALLNDTVDLDVTTTLYLENSDAAIGRLSGAGTIHYQTLTVSKDSSFTGTVDCTLKLAAGVSVTLSAEKTGITTVEGYEIKETTGESSYTYTSIVHKVAKIGDTEYVSVQAAIDALGEGQTIADIVILDADAEIPSGYAKVTETEGGAMSLRTVGSEVYWKGTSDNDWPVGVTVYTTADKNSTTTFDSSDTMVFSEDARNYPATDLGAVKIKVLSNKTYYIGHAGEGDTLNLASGSTITVEAGAQVLFSYWGNNSVQGAAKVGDITVNGAGTFGYDAVNSNPPTMGEVTGTATLKINDGETVTASSISNPISLTGTATLKVDATGTKPTSFTVPTGYQKVEGTDGAYTTYSLAPISYAITYKYADGSDTGVAAGSYTIASGAVTLADLPTVAHKTVTGWFVTADGTDAVTTFTPDAAALGDKTFYAKVAQNTVTVTVPSVDHATVAVTADSVAVTGTEGVYTVNEGATVVVTYTVADGYEKTEGELVTTYENITENKNVTAPTVSEIQVATAVTLTKGTTTLGCDYTNATVTVSVSWTGSFTPGEATFTATVGGQNYEGTYSAGEGSAGTVTFTGIRGGAGQVEDMTVSVTGGGAAEGGVSVNEMLVFGTDVNWFATTAARFNEDGTWANATADTETGKIVVSGEQTATFTPNTQMSGLTAEVVSVMAFESANDDTEIDLTGAQTAFRLASAGEGYTFQIWEGGAATPAWVDVANADLTPALNVTYTVTNAFNYTTGKVAVSVNGKLMAADGKTAFDLPTATKVNSVAVAGEGKLDGLAGSFVDTALAEDADGVKYASLAAAAGKSVTLLHDATCALGANQRLTVNANGHNLYMTGKDGRVILKKVNADGSVTYRAWKGALIIAH